MAIAPYDKIAGEYYDASHRTSRNFDQTTVAAMALNRQRVPAIGPILDVGAGRGRCNEYLGVDPQRVVQLDNSATMLQLNPRESSALRILHRAEQLPFLDDYFSCVTSFLCDPFLGLNFLAEVYRVLTPGGLFVATTPAFEWGSKLRTTLKLDLFSTRFITRSGKQIVPSVLVPLAQLREMLVRVGFRLNNFTVSTHSLPRGAEPISDDVMQPARELGRDPYDLELLYSIVANK